MFTRVVRQFRKVAENAFDHFRAHNGVHSAQDVSDSPQVFTGFRQSVNGYLSGTLESAQSVNTG
jgi:hypothetical protein